ncbi:MAG: dacD [Rickettsiales bacterium]|jgi:D-alanyl-D-alanine carboxypeptidase|nr:dacD [Rickettsiales bacterium]
MRHHTTQHSRFFLLAFALTLVATLFLASSAVAASKRKSAPPAPNKKYAGLVIDASSGTILYQENAGMQRYPASLTKMMTVYLTFEALDKGKISLDQRLLVSAFAASQPRTNLSLKKNERISVRDALMAVIIKSANDAAVVLAEGIAGSEWQFARMMTEKSRQLGMNHTQFINASGLHDARQVTTAYDLARLATALYRDHRKYYHLFSRTEFKFKGSTVRGHNRLLSSYQGADGLKTGYVNASGYNLVTSAERYGYRLVGVVLGGRSSQSRDSQMKELLNRSFRKVADLDRSGKRFTNNVPKPAPASRTKKKLQNDAGRERFIIPSLKPRITGKDGSVFAKNLIPMPQFKPVELLASESSYNINAESRGDN